MDFQDPSWNTSVSRLVILAASDFEISRGKTDRHTCKQKEVKTYPTPMRLPSTWVTKTLQQLSKTHLSAANMNTLGGTWSRLTTVKTTSRWTLDGGFSSRRSVTRPSRRGSASASLAVSRRQRRTIRIRRRRFVTERRR